MECKRRRFNFQFGAHHFFLGAETKIMAVLNVTPDSFSDGGLYERPKAALRQALKLEREGAHFIDVGGESSRPGSRPISASAEIKRVRPVLKLLAKKITVPISIDTTKYEVAQVALDEGATLVNTITALRNNRRMAKLIARYNAGVVLMHMQGSPQNMQEKTIYRDIVKEIVHYLKNAVQTALEAGIPRTHVAIDPGFGFGKTVEQNLTLLRNLDVFSQLKCPIVVGLSRKSFIGYLLGVGVSDRLYGSLGAAAAAMGNGAHILRVHEVSPHKQLAQLLDKTWN